ncbi:L,D-transpeptidase [Acuticoccus sediminis]|uniref:L,D-transpeptidase n=1 Tax=Acuticoccus sediminis TaxID=2184697 RepID=A0A8B2NFY9_9HYPH|nr:L,D-transpeptidase [Acuticoccus sediminis]RAH97799.1 L,D-transpeptidase [Acuticoccus sediminis]
MLSRRQTLAGLLATVAATETVIAQVPMPREAPLSANIDSGALAPGSFVWHPELSPEGPVIIIVSLSEQLVHVYRNGIEIGVSTCSTGKPGHDTPTGVFLILQKDRDHHSSTYNNAPMPNMQRLTWGGIALHAGNLPGYPASHGCVRLPKQFSELIFGITHLGIPVIIADEASEPEAVYHAGLMLPPEAEAEANAAIVAAAKKSHHPVDATTQTHDVVSILISGADKAAMMFMDGIEVWSSPVRIKDPERPLGNHVYKLMAADPDGAGAQWLTHPIQAVDGGDTAGEALSRVTIENWAEAVEILGGLRPGSTLVVTDLPTGDHTQSSGDFVIMRSAEV